ncbi:MAG: ATP-binding cassette domain-containing protein, partial [Deltaproteobacteria bacterium]|nr:ATP-binding cassette domain-containing protein [Deltaproteobacteria bacterium]
MEKPVLKMSTQDLKFYYGSVMALKGISMGIRKNQVTALIGPSGCGKTTFLRCLNRMNDIVEGARVEGEILLDGQNIYAPEVDVVQVRKRVGMVFQKSNPFPKTIFENVAYGLKIDGDYSRSEIADRVEKSLKDSAL